MNAVRLPDRHRNLYNLCVSTMRNTTRSAPKSPCVSPLQLANDCETLSAVMHVLTLVGTENLTVRQVLFFLAVACMDLRGTPASPACLREIYGSLGRSIETSKDQLLTKTEQNPDALDWLVSEQDQNDRHCEYLRLTPKGREVIEALSKVMAGDTPQGPVN